jgi:hypothetical protein
LPVTKFFLFYSDFSPIQGKMGMRPFPNARTATAWLGIFNSSPDDNLSALFSETDPSNRLRPNLGGGGDPDGPASCGPATSVSDEWVSGVLSV